MTTPKVDTAGHNFTLQMEKQEAIMGRIQSNNETMAIGKGVGMAVQAVGQITTASINHAMQISALNHQQNMQNKAWRASVQAIKDEGHLVDDIKTINTSKIERASTFVKSQKDLEIAEARYLEAQKTDKAMKKANKTLVKKALGDRRSRFYGKTA